VSFAPYNRCLAHLDIAQLADALGQLAPGSDVDVSGTRLNGRLLKSLLDAVRDARGRPVFGRARFDEARFDGDARFDGEGSFEQARFEGDASFAGACFDPVDDFSGAEFAGDAVFSGARFPGDHLGPVSVGGSLILDGARFAQPVSVNAAAAAVFTRGTSFAGATLQLRGGEVVIDYVTSAGPLVITADPLPVHLLPADPKHATQAPALVSAHSVDGSRVSLVNVRLAGCRFADAYNLDQLRFEGSDSRFADPPARLTARGPLALLPSARRQVLAEEWDWRTHRGFLPWPPAPGQAEPPLEPERILNLYRQLRKAQEDAKNEPGAADFYYGEMEMRRHAATTGFGEKLILGLYWALSGYGLRAMRALLALLIVLAAATAAFATVGFAPAQVTEYVPVAVAHAGAATVYQQVTEPGARPGLLDAVYYSLNSSTSLLSVTQQEQLTAVGNAVQIVLKILGPLFVGLALLAIRNRVKR
jgi:hypothetical protein